MWTSTLELKYGRDLEVWTDEEAIGEYCFLSVSHGFLSLLHIHQWLLSEGWHHPQWVEPTPSIVKQENSQYKFSCRKFLWSHFLNSYLFSQMIFLCQNQATIFITNWCIYNFNSIANVQEISQNKKQKYSKGHWTKISAK